MATNPEFNQNSNQTGDQSANSYTNVWDYFGDIGLNDQELADVMSGQPGVSVDTIDATADKADSPTGTTAGTDASAEYRSERLQPAGEHGGASTDTASTVVKIDHSPKPDSTEVTTESPDAQPEVTAEPTTAVTQEPVVTEEQPTESPVESAEQPTVTADTETVEPQESTEQETGQIDGTSSETDAEESERAVDEHEAEGSPYTKEELGQYRLPDNAEEAKAQGLLESFEENGLGHSQVDEVVRFALKNPGGVRVTLNDDQKNAFEGWMKDHSDWMDGDDARRVWRAVAPDSEKWRDPANPDDDVSKSIKGGFANPTNLADGKALLRSQQSADGKVVEKQGKAMPASARFVNKLQQTIFNHQDEKTPGIKRAKEPSKLTKAMAPAMMGLVLASTLGSAAGAVVANAKVDAGGGVTQSAVDELHQITQMSQSQLANVAKEARNQQDNRHYNASNLPATDYHMWGHDNGDGTYDCSFKKTASSFTGEIDTSSQESITKHVMESCESTPEQLAGMSVALLPQDVLEQNGYNGNVNDFADHLKDDNEARANVLNAFREVESKVNYQHATLEEGTVYKSWGISRTSDGEMVLLASGNRIVRSGGKDVLIADYGDSRMVIDPSCDNLMEIQVNEEGEVVQKSRTVHQGGDTVVHQNGGGKDRIKNKIKTPPNQGGGGGDEEIEVPPNQGGGGGDEEIEVPPNQGGGGGDEEDESKHASNVFKGQQGSQGSVAVNDNEGGANNPTGRTSQPQPGATVTSPGGKSGDSGNASGSGSGGNKSSGGSQSTTTVKTPSGSSVTGTGGISNQDGTRTNADATVRGKDGSTETANEARQKAVEADGSGSGINHGTVDIAGQD
ncbi:hypothetical protein MBO12_03940 [Candidatus Saccharibacteria bacterium]|nr:hypothetical protein [Candidatus Saccharibacteria bacterium]